MNEYFTPGTIAGHTLGRSAEVNAQLLAIQAGFDKLPTEAKLKEARQNYAADTGAANAYVVALDTAPASYTTGMEVVFLASAASTGAATVDVNGLGIKSILRWDGTALVAGDIQAGAIIVLRYDGANFRLMNSLTTSVAALPLAVANGGTGANTAGGAVTSLLTGQGAVARPLIGAVGWDLIEEVEPASVASVDFVGLDGSADLYMLVLTDLRPATDAADLWFRVRDAVLADWQDGAADYSYHGIVYGHDVDAGSPLRAGAGDSKIRLNINTGNTAPRSVSGTILCRDIGAYNGGRNRFRAQLEWQSNGGVNRQSDVGGTYGTNNQIDGLRVLFSVGNIASGRIALYKLRRS